MSGEIELLPCPFCGEERISFNPPDGEFKGSINCPGCLATMPREVNDDDELIGCWNGRALTAPKACGELRERVEIADLKAAEAAVEMSLSRMVQTGQLIGPSIFSVYELETIKAVLALLDESDVGKG